MRRIDLWPAEDGIYFPTIESSAAGMRQAIELCPQVKGDEITWPVGKGAALELCVQGVVPGRRRRQGLPTYRSHSDIDMYAAIKPYGGASEDGTESEFARVFGHMEYFPTIKSDRFQSGYAGNTEQLRCSAESVSFRGATYLVPLLEIQFVDKLLMPGEVHREEGEDALVLAATFQLDAKRVRTYLENWLSASATHRANGAQELLNTEADVLVPRLETRLAMKMRRNGSSAVYVLRELAAKSNPDHPDFDPFIDPYEAAAWRLLSDSHLSRDGGISAEGRRVVHAAVLECVEVESRNGYRRLSARSESVLAAAAELRVESTTRFASAGGAGGVEPL